MLVLNAKYSEWSLEIHGSFATKNQWKHNSLFALSSVQNTKLNSEERKQRSWNSSSVILPWPGTIFSKFYWIYHRSYITQFF